MRDRELIESVLAFLRMSMESYTRAKDHKLVAVVGALIPRAERLQHLEGPMNAEDRAFLEDLQSKSLQLESDKALIDEVLALLRSSLSAYSPEAERSSVERTNQLIAEYMRIRKHVWPLADQQRAAVEKLRTQLLESTKRPLH